MVTLYATNMGSDWGLCMYNTQRTQKSRNTNKPKLVQREMVGN